MGMLRLHREINQRRQIEEHHRAITQAIDALKAQALRSAEHAESITALDADTEDLRRIAARQETLRRALREDFDRCARKVYWLEVWACLMVSTGLVFLGYFAWWALS